MPCSEHMGFFDWVIVDSSSDEIGWFLEKPKHSLETREA